VSGRVGTSGGHQSQSGAGMPTYDSQPSFVQTSRPASHGNESGVSVSFRLDRSGRVRFVVTKLGLVCRVVGSFVVYGRAGANSVPIRASVGHRRLGAGTYRILARSETQALFAIRIVVAGGRIVARELVQPEPAESCGGPLRAIGLPAPAANRLLSAFALGTNAKPPGAAPTAAAGSQPAAPRHQALGAQFARSIVGGGIDLTRALLLGAAGLALLLLAAATLPDQFVPLTALGIVLLRRRVELAFAGVATLLAAVLAYLVYGR
jgi:hypothetical protein